MPDFRQLPERLRAESEGWKDDFRAQALYRLLTDAALNIETLEADRDRLAAAVADAVDKLAGPLGRAHVRAEKGSEQERELAEVVEQIGAIREAVEPGITAAIDALQHAQEQVGEDRG